MVIIILSIIVIIYYVYYFIIINNIVSNNNLLFIDILLFIIIINIIIINDLQLGWWIINIYSNYLFELIKSCLKHFSNHSSKFCFCFDLLNAASQTPPPFCTCSDLPLLLQPPQVSTRVCRSRAQRPRPTPPQLLKPPPQRPLYSIPAPPPVLTTAPPTTPTPPPPTTTPSPLRSCWGTTTASVWEYPPESASTPPARWAPTCRHPP